MNRLPDAEVLLTPREVADLFGVDPKTVTRWAKAGKLTSIRTLGGHRRYRKSEVDDLRANYFKAQIWNRFFLRLTCKCGRIDCTDSKRDISHGWSYESNKDESKKTQ